MSSLTLAHFKLLFFMEKCCNYLRFVFSWAREPFSPVKSDPAAFQSLRSRCMNTSLPFQTYSSCYLQSTCNRGLVISSTWKIMGNKKTKQSQQLWRLCFSEETESSFLPRTGLGEQFRYPEMLAPAPTGTLHQEFLSFVALNEKTGKT